ncbi:MAG: hypothetical protein UW69_C0046G0009 [Microgenomates group bacterium GW2011_GWA2_44_7]|nr:MAG: hypothetical protein UW69_C0046G0009 [Microgenomates group bacterium GW2011_GWA2_44_7]
MNSKSEEKQTGSSTIGLLERVRRTPYQSFVATLTVALTLFVIGAIGAFSLGSVIVLNFFETRPQVVGFYKPEIVPTTAQIDGLKSRLMQTGKVLNIQYISKEQALDIYKAPFKDDQILLELATAKMLPATIKVSAVDPRYLADVSELLKSEQGIYLVDFQKDIVNALTRWTDAIRQVGIGVIAVCGLIAFVMIFVVVSFKLVFKKDEVEIINLIGGGRWYIYKPFFQEAVFYGFIGAIIGWLADVLVLLYATPFLVWFLSGIPILPIPWFFYVGLFTAQVFIGLGICTVATWVAIRRYLAR